MRAFGSRASWTAKDYSDLDLAIVGAGPLDWRTLSRLKEAFEESDLPMRVDVLDWHAISESFRKVIEQGYVVVQQGGSSDGSGLSDGWRMCTLEELTENFDAIRIPVKQSDRCPGPYPYYGASGVVDRVDGFLFDGQYLLIAEDGENLRTRTTPIAFLADGKFWVNNHAHIVRGNSSADTRFLNYALSGLDVSGYLTGSTMPKLTQGNMNRISLLTPPLPEQRAIAYVLGTLDDKIELNRRMNETLEEMARALFKSWFVDFDPVRAKMEGRDTGLPPDIAVLFPDRLVESELGEIPEGWEVRALGECFKVAVGGIWGKDVPEQDAQEPLHCLRGIDCHALAEGRIPDAPTRWVAPRQLENRRIPSGALLIEASGSFCGRSLLWRNPYSNLFDQPVSYSNFVKRLDPICSIPQAEVCWQFVREAFRNNEIQAYRTGTAFPNLDVKALLARLLVVMPSNAVSDTYAHLSGWVPSTDLMTENRTLAALRDMQLPRLVSGELGV